MILLGTFVSQLTTFTDFENNSNFFYTIDLYGAGEIYSLSCIAWDVVYDLLFKFGCVHFQVMV